MKTISDFLESAKLARKQSFKNLERFEHRLTKASPGHPLTKNIVYGGDTAQNRSTVQVLPWRDVHNLMTFNKSVN